MKWWDIVADLIGGGIIVASVFTDTEVFVIPIVFIILVIVYAVS